MTLQFQQQTTTATPADNPILLDSVSGFAIAFNIYQTPFLDMRAFNSLALRLRMSGGDFLNSNPISVDLRWSADPAGTIVTFSEQYYIYRSDVIGSGNFLFTDQIHGAYLRMIVGNADSVPRTTNLEFNLYGSYRDIAAPWIRMSSNAILSERRDILGAGASASGPARYGFGRCIASLQSGAGGGATMVIGFGTSAATSILRTVLVAAAANTRVEKEFILPRRQPFVTITNNGAAGSTIDSYIIQQGYPQ